MHNGVWHEGKEGGCVGTGGIHVVVVVGGGGVKSWAGLCSGW